MAVVRHMPGNVNQLSVFELARAQGAFGEIVTSQLNVSSGWNLAQKINSELVDSAVTGAGTITTASGLGVLATGAQTNSSAKIASTHLIRYIPGVGAVVRFTAIFTSGVVGSTQIIGAGDETDGFFFGYNGAAFGVLHRNNGVDTWTSQTSWNLDEMDGTTSSGMTLDPTKGNVYQIRYQWLGFGAIEFAVENPASGKFVDVHRIHYANANTAPSLTHPTLPCMAEVKNTTNNTSIALKTGSAMGATEGPAIQEVYDVHHTYETSKASITAEVPLFTLRNSTTYQSVVNKVRIRSDAISLATDGTKPVTIQAYKNPIVTSTSAYTDFNALTSVAQINVASTAASSGILAFALQMAKADQLFLDLSLFALNMRPGEHLTVTAKSSAAADVFVAFTWMEQF